MRSAAITPEQLAARLTEPDCVVLDCRFSLADPEAGRRAYLAGHVPGAHYAHLDEDLSGAVVPGETGRHPLPAPEVLAGKLGHWGVTDGVDVVVYDDAGGAIAARAWWLLRWLGHAAVAVLDGGFPAWVESGGAISSEVPESSAALFVPRIQNELVVLADEVAELARRSDARLLDARAAERFRGEVEPIDAVAGHIPGARSLPLTDNLDSGRLKNPDEIRTRFARALEGVPAEHSVAYCGSGVTACHLIWAAEVAGVGAPRLYPGSWSEWIADGTRPVARGE